MFNVINVNTVNVNALNTITIVTLLHISADSVSHHRPSRDNLTSLAIPNILRLELQQIFISLWTETKDSSYQDFLTRKRAVKIVDI